MSNVLKFEQKKEIQFIAFNLVGEKSFKVAFEKEAFLRDKHIDAAISVLIKRYSNQIKKEVNVSIHKIEDTFPSLIDKSFLYVHDAETSQLFIDNLIDYLENIVSNNKVEDVL